MNILSVENLVEMVKVPTPTNDENLPPSPSLKDMEFNPENKGAGKKKSNWRMFSGAKKRGFGYHNLDLLAKRKFQEPSNKPIDLVDISYAIMNGDIKWQDLKFEDKHIEFIRTNKKLVIQSNLVDEDL